MTRKQPQDHLEPLAERELMSEAELADHSGYSRGTLRQRRYLGLPPKFLKPSPKKVLYRRSDVEDWLNGSERTVTEHGR